MKVLQHVRLRIKVAVLAEWFGSFAGIVTASDEPGFPAQGETRVWSKNEFVEMPDVPIQAHVDAIDRLQHDLDMLRETLCVAKEPIATLPRRVQDRAETLMKIHEASLLRAAKAT